MYAINYALSLGLTAASMTGSTYTNRTTLKTGWMHISNNDSAAYQYEWTSSRDGYDGNAYLAWYVNLDGYVEYNYVPETYSARPVFYLTSDVTISGEGSIANPFIVS